MSRRPASLSEVADAAIADPAGFALAHDAFLDDFYLDHGDKVRQQRKLADAPRFTGVAFSDAWVAAVAEHLAQRWNLCVPAWTRRPEHARLTLPHFVPDCASLRGMLLVMSPPAFRSRMLFTVSEPLQRARFPRAEPPMGHPLTWPPECYPRSGPARTA